MVNAAKRWCWLGMALGVVVGIASGLSAGEKWALLVGVDDYENQFISDLQYAVSDVKSLAETLKVKTGFPPAHVVVMTSDEASGLNRPSHVNVIKRLDGLARQMKPEDTFLFYFSGHGYQREGGRSFLATVNSDPASIETLAVSSIPLELLRNKMKDIKARQVIFIIDACRNDPTKGRGDRDNSLSADFSKGIIVAAKSAASGMAGTAVLFACSEGERAYEWPERKHGVFSYFLLEALGGAAIDFNGELTMTNVADYVQRHVLEWCAQQFPTGDRKQTPDLFQTGAAKLVLASGPAAFPDRGTVLRLPPGGLGNTSVPPAPPPAPATPSAPRRAVVADIRQASAISQYAADANCTAMRIHCRRDQLTTPAIQALKDWVAAGHVVVVENDVAELFGYTVSKPWWLNPDVAVLGVKENSHPLIHNVSRVRFTGRECWVATAHASAQPLLMFGDNPRQGGIPLAVATLGSGRVVFLTAEIDLTKYDGAILSRNLDAYLKSTPAATDGAHGEGAQPTNETVIATPPPAAPAGGGKVGDVRTAAAILQYVRDPSYATLRIHCALNQFSSLAAEALQRWVTAGHTVVLENDAAQLFGYKVEKPWYVNANAVLGVKEDSHPMIQNVRQVQFSGRGGWVTKGHPTAMPLLIDPDPRQQPCAYLAVTRYGNGIAIFQTQGLTGAKYDGDILAKNIERCLKQFPQPIPTSTAAGGGATRPVQRGKPVAVGIELENVLAGVARVLGLPDTRGAVVSKVAKNSPADRAGIRRGDILRSLDGITVRDADVGRTLMRRCTEGMRIRVELYRNKRRMLLQLDLAPAGE